MTAAVRAYTSSAEDREPNSALERNVVTGPGSQRPELSQAETGCSTGLRRRRITSLALDEDDGASTPPSEGGRLIEPEPQPISGSPTARRVSKASAIRAHHAERYLAVVVSDLLRGPLALVAEPAGYVDTQ